jgi:hypothetical protein
MIAMEAVKEVMRIKDVRPSVLCDRLKIKANVLSSRFTQKNVSVDKLNEMLRAMDYKVIIVPRETKVPENGFEVE